MQTCSKSSIPGGGKLKNPICIIDMDSGIYKWISPTGRIYVGQSKNLKKRKEWYVSGGIVRAKMPKLKRSFEKYGIENHLFEIIECCPLDKLNEREIYWGLFYNTLEKGLNCKLGEQNCIFSNSTKNKMSEAKKGTVQTEQQIKLRKEKTKKTWKKKMEEGFKKKSWKPTKEWKEKISKANKGKIVSEETKQKISNSRKGMKLTDEHKTKISKSKKGKKVHSPKSKQKLSEIGKQRDMTKVFQAGSKARSIPVSQFDIYGNFIKTYPSSNAAEFELNGKPGDNIRSCIRGRQKTSYGFIWKETY
jgi:group I intron endonuclease